jgi:hypothetical protein
MPPLQAQYTLFLKLYGKNFDVPIINCPHSRTETRYRLLHDFTDSL